MDWKCAKCETVNRGDQQSCEVCGRARPAAATAPARGEAAFHPIASSLPGLDGAVVSPWSGGRHICRCGHSFISASEWFCPQCGQAQYGLSACPGCGKKTYSGAPFCRHCGRRLGE